MGRRPPLADLSAPGKYAGILGPGTLPGREITVLAALLTEQLMLLMLHLLRSPPSRISGQLPTLDLFHLSLPFPSHPTLLHSMPRSASQRLSQFSSLLISGMEVDSRLRRLGKKAKGYFCQFIHLSRKLIYQTLIEHLLCQPL